MGGLPNLGSTPLDVVSNRSIARLGNPGLISIDFSAWPLLWLYDDDIA